MVLEAVLWPVSYSLDRRASLSLCFFFMNFTSSCYSPRFYGSRARWSVLYDTGVSIFHYLCGTVTLRSLTLRWLCAVIEEEVCDIARLGEDKQGFPSRHGQHRSRRFRPRIVSTHLVPSSSSLFSVWVVWSRLLPECMTVPPLLQLPLLFSFSIFFFFSPLCSQAVPALPLKQCHISPP